MNEKERNNQVHALLDGLSGESVRETCIAALRQWHQVHPGRPRFSVHGDLGPRLINLLYLRKGLVQPDEMRINELKETFVDTSALSEPWMLKVVEFWTWFTRAGLGWPLGARPNEFPINYHLTSSGKAFLSETEDHPLLPGYIDRISRRSPGIPNEVLCLLSDGQACLDRALTRPAVTLLGLAYEHAVERVVQILTEKSILQRAELELKAARRIQAVRGALGSIFHGAASIDNLNAAAQACDFADHIRRRRNDASHTQPQYGFEDRTEVEELFVSAGRHLPNLWRVTR